MLPSLLGGNLGGGRTNADGRSSKEPCEPDAAPGHSSSGNINVSFVGGVVSIVTPTTFIFVRASPSEACEPSAQVRDAGRWRAGWRIVHLALGTETRPIFGKVDPDQSVQACLIINYTSRSGGYRSENGNDAGVEDVEDRARFLSRAGTPPDSRAMPARSKVLFFPPAVLVGFIPTG